MDSADFLGAAVEVIGAYCMSTSPGRQNDASQSSLVAGSGNSELENQERRLEADSVLTIPINERPQRASKLGWQVFFVDRVEEGDG